MSQFGFLDFPGATATTAKTSPSPRVIPAQVNFLTIFNPLLGGDSDETEPDQILLWTSKRQLLKQHRQHRRLRSRTVKGKSGDGRSRRGVSDNDNDGEGVEEHDEETQDQQEEEERNIVNERLRQIGLARGMVEFAKNFSDDKPVTSVETSRSRMILHELEPNWWILSSIDLTRLPATQVSTPSKTNANRKGATDEGVRYEYSSREVATPQLLLAQLLRAHSIFLLHHAPSLQDLYSRSRRPHFCALLEKYWERFVWDWNVLLHGSPAIDIYGSCVKLAGGGELGIGVGEEEWGSGEREVIECFLGRTEGCADLIIGRYGQAPTRNKGDKSSAEEEVITSAADRDNEPWLGTGEDPGPADGVIFSGIGTLSRRSLATVSQWMEAIFKHGEDAYGVGENPAARPRGKRVKHTRLARRKQEVSQTSTQQDGKPGSTASKQGQVFDTHPPQKSSRSRPPDLRRQAMENSASPPGIPPPLVAAVDRSLDEALATVAQRAKSVSPRSSPKEEKSEEQAMSKRSEHASDTKDDDSSSSSWFDASKMTKVFTLGYGSSWTLNPKGFADQNSNGIIPTDQSIKKHEEDLIDFDDEPSRPSIKLAPSSPPKQLSGGARSRPAEERLQEIDPTPEASDDENEQPFVQRLEKSSGKFLIGLTGDLENMEMEVSENEDDGYDSSVVGNFNTIPTSAITRAPRGGRIYFRTLTVEVARPPHRASITSVRSDKSYTSFLSSASGGSNKRPDPKTSAASSVDGPAQPTRHSEKMRVAVYVHQPFIFVFLFALQTPSLTMPQFYRSIHHQLGPLQKPLLSRTDPEIVAQRIKDLVLSKFDEKRPSNVENSLARLTASATAAAVEENTIYDLVYDPVRLTIRTSIPNIPIPTAFSERDSNTKTTLVSGSWYTLGIPIGSSSRSNGTSRSPSRLRKSSDHKSIKSRAEEWTRTDALNVHMQILHTFTNIHVDHQTRTTSMTSQALAPLIKDDEIERTTKTTRGWWILWLRVARPADNLTSNRSTRSTSSSLTQRTATDNHGVVGSKEAFLIRKSNDSLMSVKTSNAAAIGGGGDSSSNRSAVSTAGRWLLREQSKDLGSSSGGGSSGRSNTGMSSSGGGGAGGGATEGRGRGGGMIDGSGLNGVGVDARRWIDALLHLST